jgi:hypothetical protein
VCPACAGPLAPAQNAEDLSNRALKTGLGGFVARTIHCSHQRPSRPGVKGVWCIVSLPAGTFINVGASVRANSLFFTRGRSSSGGYASKMHRRTWPKS